MASNGSDAAYHESATTWHVARDLAEQAGRGMKQRSQPAAQGARRFCMQQLTVVSLVFALFMMDALRTAGVLPCSNPVASRSRWCSARWAAPSSHSLLKPSRPPHHRLH